MLRILRGDVRHVVIVDNGSRELDEGALRAAHDSVTIQRLPENRGIAAAQNEGIGVARRLNAEFVLFLDQDSTPQAEMVKALLESFRRLEVSGARVGCIGPRTRAPGDSEISPFRRLGWWRVRRVPCSEPAAIVECDVLISSGMLTRMAALERIGGMEDALFIDSVDSEWCFRARAQGFGVFGACAALLEHRLGERQIRVWLGHWLHLPRHRPFRYYYIFRNTVLMVGRDYVPLKWFILQFKVLAVLFLFFGVSSIGRSAEVRMMLKGLVHGMRRITGKLDEAG